MYFNWSLKNNANSYTFFYLAVMKFTFNELIHVIYMPFYLHDFGYKFCAESHTNK